jgi:hypothetical protein
MARINRSDVIQKAVNDLAISTSLDKIPNETLDKVQLTYDLNRKFSNFLVSGASVTTGSITITPPIIDAAKQEIYITGIDIGYVKDATNDIANGQITLTATLFESGISKNLILLPVITLTAQTDHVNCQFTYPIKLKPNSTMVMTSSYSLGLMSRSISVTGFTTSSN